MKKRRGIVLVAFPIAFLPLTTSCGGEQGKDLLYSLIVFNSTDSTITVRYDWDSVFISFDWQSDTTILPGNNRIIEWSSGKWGGEQIEVEYLGKKKLSSVPQF